MTAPVELSTSEVPLTGASSNGGPRLMPPTVDVPESRRYRLKTKVLGPPLHTDQLAHERLGIPTALAVFSSDCISSSAYATEQILTRLIPFIGLLWVPFYNFANPPFLGFPFFYWYQLAWIPLVAILSTIAYLLVRRSR